MKHILMVDDVTTNLKSAAEVLQPYYQLSMAKSGKQALQFLKKNTPDLILLDLMMPDMDGYETMEQIKLNPMTANIPIIFLTADTEQASETKGLKMGAMDYITKPFETEVMLGRIEKVLMMEDMRKDLLRDSVEDEQTGLLTEKEIARQIDQMIDRVHKNPVFFDEQTIIGTAVLVNIDNFRKYNESLGREEGDKLLKDLAEFYKDWQKEIYPDVLIGKLDADEFLFFFPSLSEMNKIMRICGSSGLDEILPSLGYHSSLNHDEPFARITASYACAYLRGSDTGYDMLYRNLAKAMYHVKHSARNRYCSEYSGGWCFYEDQYMKE